MSSANSPECTYMPSVQSQESVPEPQKAKTEAGWIKKGRTHRVLLLITPPLGQWLIVLVWNSPSPPLPSLLFNVMEAQPLSFFALISLCSWGFCLGRNVVWVLMTVCLMIPSPPPTFKLLPFFGDKGRTEDPEGITSYTWGLGPKFWGLGVAHTCFM